jgi:hypothetical protein
MTMISVEDVHSNYVMHIRADRVIALTKSKHVHADCTIIHMDNGEKFKSYDQMTVISARINAALEKEE